jgi:hypothetical protein
LSESFAFAHDVDLRDTECDDADAAEFKGMRNHRERTLTK